MRAGTSVAGGRKLEIVALAALLAAAAIASAIGGRDASADAEAMQPRIGDGRGGVRLNELSRFDQPVYVGAPSGAGNLAFVVERAGVIKLLKGDNKLDGSFLDISDLVSCCDGERGLFTVAFPPNYQRSGRFYVYFTNGDGNIEIDEFKRSRGSAKRADRGSRRKLLEVPHAQFNNHNGGQVEFGPHGLLYAGTGDGGGSGDPDENAQDKGSLLGKLLRIDPRKGNPYGVPRSNPYVGGKGANEIYARGLRNPWRFSFDRKRILIADVGQDAWEEVDMERVRAARGANFGWDVFEGTHPFEGGSLKRHDKPIFEYANSGNRCAISGGYVVRDRRLKSLYGRYLYADLCEGEIRSFIPNRHGARDDKSLAVERKPGTVSFGVDDRKRIYVVVMDSGVLIRLDPR